MVAGETGLLVDPLSVEEIAGAIARLIGDRALVVRMGEAGRRRAEREFDWRLLARRIEAIL